MVQTINGQQDISIKISALTVGNMPANINLFKRFEVVVFTTSEQNGLRYRRYHINTVTNELHVPSQDLSRLAQGLIKVHIYASIPTDNYEDGTADFERVYNTNYYLKNGVIDLNPDAGGGESVNLSDFWTKYQVQSAITKSQEDLKTWFAQNSGQTVDLSDYYTKDFIDDKVSGLGQRISLNSLELSGYGSRLGQLVNDFNTYKSEAYDILTAYINEHFGYDGDGNLIDLSNYYTKSETDTIIDGKYRSLEGWCSGLESRLSEQYNRISDFDSRISSLESNTGNCACDMSGYYTKEEVQGLIDRAIQGILSGNTSGNTSGETSGSTSGNTSGSTDTSGSTSGSTSGETSGSTSGSTSGETSGSTSGNTSGSTSADTQSYNVMATYRGNVWNHSEVINSTKIDTVKSMTVNGVKLDTPQVFVNNIPNWDYSEGSINGVLFEFKDSEIPEFAFYGSNVPILSITAYDGITRVGANAFFAKHDLTHVHLPSTLQSIYHNAFEGCTGINDMSFNGKMSKFASMLDSRNAGLTAGTQVRCTDGVYTIQ